MKNKLGFTLIELLVIVLIIGILASVALPQYNRVVWKSRATNLYTQITAIRSAIERYYMVHDTWASEFDDLDIDIAGESTTGTACQLMDAGGKSLIQRDGFGLKIQQSPHNTAYAVFTSGPYACAGFAYYTRIDRSGTKLYCVEIPISFSGEQGDFCEKTMGYSFVRELGGVNWFTD